MNQRFTSDTVVTDSEIALDRASDVFYPTNPDLLLRRDIMYGPVNMYQTDRGHC